MLTKTQTETVRGVVDGLLVRVEVGHHEEVTAFRMVGLSDAVVPERVTEARRVQARRFRRRCAARLNAFMMPHLY